MGTQQWIDTAQHCANSFFGFTQDHRLNTTAAGRLRNPKTSVSLVAHERYSRVALATRAAWTYLMNRHENRGVNVVSGQRVTRTSLRQ